MLPIILYSHSAGPNPKKVRMVLEELSIPYHVKTLEFPEMKQPSFLNVNPNGRVPAIIDPNTDITLWESGAIIEYLVQRYDPQQTISFRVDSPEYYQVKQWLHFQMSGQGPYFGQAVWFKVHHPEFIQSCYDRYFNEIARVAGVLNGALEKQEYLVGDRCSVADISFVIWFQFVPWITDGKLHFGREYPFLNAWLNRLESRPAIQKVLAGQTSLPEPARQKSE
ncbi:glutathione S-transferase family protein [Aspergillus puulaauensis]|uniref:glutathione transferase n=1 Tax=Aspergillus puulaauensis TaxID=1220207 RepID=A0A7R7Y029_9EURO|nr:glutathione S-transferase, nitrogen catabolite repression regulator [Aspergillus puulaauensis]BCS30003.1 glutathione S-transferase, nitrogen catabolite repression regulator [Aspergillus puulaauensis]